MNEYHGTATLVRIILRRDRLRLAIWVVMLVALILGTAAAIRDLISTQEVLVAATQLYVVNPVMRLFGLASGATLGGFLMTRAWLIYAILIALMSTFAVVRSTRLEEDTGRAELVGSMCIGRRAPLAATLIVVAGLNLLLGLLAALGLIVLGFAAKGAFLAGIALAGTGIAFAGVAAVMVQLAPTARSANGLSGAAIGLGFLVAGIGNMWGTVRDEALVVESAWPVWLSPFGWGQQMRPYGGDHLWPAVLFIVFFAAMVLLASQLVARRDLGQGLFPQRPGPAAAPPNLAGPVGLAWRLQRPMFFGWLGGIIAIAAVYGAVSGEIEGLLETMEEAAELFERVGGAAGLVAGYFSAIGGVLAMFVTVYTVVAVLRLRNEETMGPLEPLLSTALGRRRWMSGHILNAALGSSVLLVTAGIVAGGIGGWLLGETAHWLEFMTLSALVQVPALWIVGSFAVAGFGWFPRHATLVAWGGFAVALLFGPFLGAMLGMPEWTQRLSPFGHTAEVPLTAQAIGPILGLLLVAVALTWLGLVGFRRRDIHPQ